MEARFLGELADSRLARLYWSTPGPWRAPFFGQMGSSSWVYHMQHICRRMVEAYEEQRQNKRYDWVVFARADLFWTYRHPAAEILDPRFVHIPFGQDNSYYADGPLPGVNDRHAIVPRALVNKYFTRWDHLVSGQAWSYLRDVAEARFPVNTEQFLLLHLNANDVIVRRFSPVAFVIHCAEGPQCQHLYKGTNLGKQQWTQTAKYWSELIETRRTLVDDKLRLDRVSYGWMGRSASTSSN